MVKLAWHKDAGTEIGSHAPVGFSGAARYPHSAPKPVA
jgi:hypothetical protein